ncbi:MAG TPA: hypothetical protein VGI66_03520 [Streptosporangiaceae bacterium]|jgi:hypothetical protein
MTEKKVTFEAFEAYRRSPVYASVGHASRVLSVKLGNGNDFRGQPIWSRNVASKALCGVQIGKGSGGSRYDAPVNCSRCLAQLRKLERTGRDGHASPEAIAAAELLGAMS